MRHRGPGGLNDIELILAAYSATLWALPPAVFVYRAIRFGDGHTLQSLERWFHFRVLPLPLSAFATVFVVALSVHLTAASWRMPPERFDRATCERFGLLGVLVFSLALLVATHRPIF
ncbi:MAG: hypothetical protein ACAI25_11365 [Planctomycetota bacterium]